MIRRCITLCLFFATLAVALPARAIPPFARRYGFACSTCHVGAPTKLNAFGEAFRDNGYRIPGDDTAYLQSQPTQLGAPERSALFPRAIWPGEIPGLPPIGVAATAGVSATLPSDGNVAGRQLAAAANVKLLLGGGLGRHFSVFGVVEGGTDGIALDQVHLVIRSLFDRWIGESAFNLKIGRMEMDIFPIQPGLYRASDRLKPEFLELAVGRDGFKIGEPTEAIEAYGLIAGRVKWVVGVTNGQKPLNDLTTRRDFFGRVSVKLGGTRLDYKDVSPTTSDTIAVNIGAAAYVGREVATPAAVTPEIAGAPVTTPGPFKSDVYRVLGDVRLRMSHDFDLLGQVVLGQDSNPDGDAQTVRHVSWLVGLDYAIFPWLQPFARFEETRFDSSYHSDLRRVVAGLAIALRTNLLIRAEGAAALTKADAHVALVEAFFAM
jgi:hypothetical protein